MRPGDVVLYVETAGIGTDAQVTAVTGAGVSGYKVLDLVTAAGREVRLVPNVRDSDRLTGYWCAEEAEIRPSLRRRRAPVHVEDEE